MRKRTYEETDLVFTFDPFLIFSRRNYRNRVPLDYSFTIGWKFHEDFPEEIVSKLQKYCHSVGAMMEHKDELYATVVDTPSESRFDFTSFVKLVADLHRKYRLVANVRTSFSHLLDSRFDGIVIVSDDGIDKEIIIDDITKTVSISQYGLENTCFLLERLLVEKKKYPDCSFRFHIGFNEYFDYVEKRASFSVPSSMKSSNFIVSCNVIPYAQFQLHTLFPVDGISVSF